jgi:hypothetical protein
MGKLERCIIVADPVRPDIRNAVAIRAGGLRAGSIGKDKQEQIAPRRAPRRYRR